jgi:hypothetical protein
LTTVNMVKNHYVFSRSSPGRPAPSQFGHKFPAVAIRFAVVTGSAVVASRPGSTVTADGSSYGIRHPGLCNLNGAPTGTGKFSTRITVIAAAGARSTPTPVATRRRWAALLHHWQCTGTRHWQ